MPSGSPIILRLLRTFVENHGQTLGRGIVTPDRAVCREKSALIKAIHHSHDDDAITSCREQFMGRGVNWVTAGMVEVHLALLCAVWVPREAINPRRFVHGSVEHQPPAEVELRGTDAGGFEVGQASRLGTLPNNVAWAWVSPAEANRCIGGKFAFDDRPRIFQERMRPPA